MRAVTIIGRKESPIVKISTPPPPTTIVKAVPPTATKIIQPPATKVVAPPPRPLTPPPPPILVPFVPIVKGTVEGLLSAAADEEKLEIVTKTIVALKKTVAWNDLLEDDVREYKEGEIINLPNFRSILPRLPCEPIFENGDDNNKHINKKKKHDVSIQRSDDKNKAAGGKADSSKGGSSSTNDKDSKSNSSGALAMTVDYPYPVDSWWPSVSSIRRERRSKGERTGDDNEDYDNDDEPGLSNEPDFYHPLFRADLPTIHKQISMESEPGVLEKVPHCRIHRMVMKSQKVANAPDHAFCWQVTENYCNHPMVCCSICSTWRHAACGGHYKSYTIRDSMHEPFVPVCDRCHIEQEILADYPKALPRLERQRVEQLRRGLSTSHVIRKASFAKHGGTYKWPLGSVSATHIGGHTRSVHSRHDKAEKQWSEMVTRLSPNSRYRPKERMKIRTRELERLLVSIEDSEGATDRHNMMLFLQQDVRADKPVGYEKRRRNIFDPEDDEVLPVASPESDQDNEDEDNNDDGGDYYHHSAAEESAVVEYAYAFGRRARKVKMNNNTATSNNSQNTSRPCARKGCRFRCRFDSIFCSDACGVSGLELDLLHAFQYSTDIHPSLLRS